MSSSLGRTIAASLFAWMMVRGVVGASDHHGLYRAADGRALILCPAPFKADQTAMVEFETGRARVLFSGEQAGNAFTFGPSLAVREPVLGTVTLHRNKDGQVATVECRDGTDTPRRYQRIALHQEPVKFSNDGSKLAGTLILPEGAGPFPGVVMLHGSDPEPREGTLGMALLMVSQGVAALIFDKRGVGESSGPDWRASFDAYAGDALAAFEVLRADRRLNAMRLGYWGHSQGAWIAALAGSKTRDAAFVVLECGGAVSPVDATLWWGRCRLESDSPFSREQIDACEAYRRQKFDVVAGRMSRAELEPHTAKARGEAWFPRVTEKLPHGPFWEANAAYDPAPALAGLGHCSVLAIFAQHDDSTPTEASVRAMKAAFERAKHPAYLVRTIADANHALLETKTLKPMEQEAPALDRFHPAYLEALSEWMREKVVK